MSDYEEMRLEDDWRRKRELEEEMFERGQGDRMKTETTLAELERERDLFRHDYRRVNDQAFKHRAEIERLMEAMEMAWGVIANVSEGVWEDQEEEWQDAAKRWRDEHWHPALDRNAEKDAGAEA